MRLRWAVVGAIAALLVLAVTGTAAWGWRTLHIPHAGWKGDHVDVVLEPGLHAFAVPPDPDLEPSRGRRRLARVAHQVLERTANLFRIAQRRLGPGRNFHCMRWLVQAQSAFYLMCDRANNRVAFGK